MVGFRITAAIEMNKDVGEKNSFFHSVTLGEQDLLFPMGS